MDSRFPTYYLNDRRVIRAKPDVFRLFVLATAWSVSNMTDGRIDTADLYLIPFGNEDDADALVAAGLWQKDEDGYSITDFRKTQTSAAALEASLLNRRARDAERQKKKYDKDKGKGDTPTEPNQISREDHVSLEGRGRGKEEAEERHSFDEEVTTQEEQQVPVTPSSEEPPDPGQWQRSPGLDASGWPAVLGHLQTPQEFRKAS